VFCGGCCQADAANKRAAQGNNLLKNLAWGTKPSAPDRRFLDLGRIGRN